MKKPPNLPSYLLGCDEDFSNQIRQEKKCYAKKGRTKGKSQNEGKVYKPGRQQAYTCTQPFTISV